MTTLPANPHASVAIEPVELIRDARGWVIEPVDEAGLQGKRNIHIVWTEPGAVRGNHYHERTQETIVVLGPALVRLRENQTVRDISVPDGTAMRFTIPPGVPHAIQNTGSRPMILMAFTDQLHDRAHPDTVPCLLIPPS